MQARVIIKSLLTCINYCHRKGIVHRDLKPDNILLLKDKKYDCLKVIDFGLAAYCPKDETMKKICGTPYYMAPEIWAGKKYTQNVDIWAIGVIAYELLAKEHLFDGKTKEDIRNNVING